MDAGRPLSGIRAKLYEVMVAQPKYWEPYYGGTEAERALARKYSFSDRLRYYWPEPAIELKRSGCHRSIGLAQGLPGSGVG